MLFFQSYLWGRSCPACITSDWILFIVIARRGQTPVRYYRTAKDAKVFFSVEGDVRAERAQRLFPAKGFNREGAKDAKGFLVFLIRTNDQEKSHAQQADRSVYWCGDIRT